MDALGKSPIPIPMLILCKLSMVFCWLFFLVDTTGIDSMLYSSIVTDVIAAVSVGTGVIILILAFVSLGSSVSVGLPREETRLKTHGIFQFSRNPMYLSAILLCTGSCLFFIHPANFLFGIIIISIDHWIIIKEEKFLEERFGSEYLEYKNQVCRYFGRRRKTKSLRLT